MSTLKVTILCVLMGLFFGMNTGCKEETQGSTNSVQTTTEMVVENPPMKDVSRDTLGFANTGPLRGNSNNIHEEEQIINVPDTNKVQEEIIPPVVKDFATEVSEIYGIDQTLIHSYLKKKGPKQALILALEMRKQALDKNVLTLSAPNQRKNLKFNKNSLIINDYSKSAKDIRAYIFNFETNELLVLALGAGGGNTSSIQNSSLGKTILGDQNGSYLTPPGFFILDLNHERYSEKLQRYVIPTYGVTVAMFVGPNDHIVTNKNKGQTFMNVMDLKINNMNSFERGILMHSSHSWEVIEKYGVPGNTSQGCLTLINEDYLFIKAFLPKGTNVLVLNYGDQIFKKGKNKSLVRIEQGLKEGTLTEAFVMNNGQDTVFVRTNLEMFP